MQNLVLYRKYRPKDFDEIIGQKTTVQTLKNAVAMGLISHAYLFSGPRGSGKTSIARILAKALNCVHIKKDGNPCNACSSCEEINAGRAIDLIEIDAASNGRIDEMRDLKEGVRFAPTKLKYKVFIIDEAHQLSKDAANALLKTLEEPPSHAIFILATTEPHKMIPTILSRCQQFDFKRLTVLEIVECLSRVAKYENAKIEKSALEAIALQSSGSLRDATGLLEKVLTFHSGQEKSNAIDAVQVKELLGIVDINVIAEFADFLLQKSAGKAVEFLNKNLEEGTDPYEFAKNAVQYVRQLLLLKIEPNLAKDLIQGFTKEQEERIQKQALAFEEPQLQKAVESFADAENKMKYASIIQLPLELAIIDSCA